MVRKFFSHLRIFSIYIFSVYSFIWLILETSTYFGWITLSNTGLWMHITYVLVSIIIAFILTYFHFMFLKQEVEKQITQTSNFISLLDFHDTFKHVNWSSLLGKSEENLDVVVYYFDSWVNQHEDAILQYLSKRNSKIRVFVADPRDQDLLKNINRLFPEYSQQVIKEKIEHTKERFVDLFFKAGANSNRFEFYYYPYFLNYSCQVLDNKVLVLSVFEMHRNKKIDSPAVVIDLEKSKHLKGFIQKELDGIINHSNRIF